MDPRDRLRLRLAGSACTACGRRYGGDDVRVLAQREDVAFVRLRCRGCGVETLALVTGGPAEHDGFAAPPGDLTPADEARLADGRPVDADDVLAVHRFLADYEGDLRGLLGGHRRPGPTGQGSAGR